PGTEQVTMRWTAQGGVNTAYAVTIIAALAAVALVVGDRRRRPERLALGPESLLAPPRLDAGNGRRPGAAPVRQAIIVGAVWAASAGLLIDPWWALWGLVGG